MPRGQGLNLDPQALVRGRPQPLHHPRLDLYQITSLQHLSAYCYTCDSCAVGAEVLLHLFFGELGCKYCYHSITSCEAFRNEYPLPGRCCVSRGAHNACRWTVPPCNYLMYHTRRHLSMIKGTSKLEKTDVFRAATIYLRGVLPLRRIYPWRAALKTVAKAGIGVDLSNLPPRLKRIHNSKNEVGSKEVWSMPGVSGLLQLEKSIARLEKKTDTTLPSFPQPPQELGNCDVDSDLEDVLIATHIPGTLLNTLSANNVTPEKTQNKAHKTKKRKLNALGSLKDADRTFISAHDAYVTSDNTPLEDGNMNPERQTKKHKKKKKLITPDSLKNISGAFINTHDAPVTSEDVDISPENRLTKAHKRKKMKLSTLDSIENTALTFTSTHDTPLTSENTPLEYGNIIPENRQTKELKSKKRKLNNLDSLENTGDTPIDTHNAPVTSERTDISPGNRYDKVHKTKKRKRNTLDNIENTDGTLIKTYDGPSTSYSTPSKDSSIDPKNRSNKSDKSKKRKVNALNGLKNINEISIHTHDALVTSENSNETRLTKTKKSKTSKIYANTNIHESSVNLENSVMENEMPLKKKNKLKNTYSKTNCYSPSELHSFPTSLRNELNTDIGSEENILSEAFVTQVNPVKPPKKTKSSKLKNSDTNLANPANRLSTHSEMMTTPANTESLRRMRKGRKNTLPTNIDTLPENTNPSPTKEYKSKMKFKDRALDTLVTSDNIKMTSAKSHKGKKTKLKTTSNNTVNVPASEHYTHSKTLDSPTGVIFTLPKHKKRKEDHPCQ